MPDSPVACTEGLWSSRIQDDWYLTLGVDPLNNGNTEEFITDTTTPRWWTPFGAVGETRQMRAKRRKICGWMHSRMFKDFQLNVVKVFGKRFDNQISDDIGESSIPSLIVLSTRDPLLAKGIPKLGCNKTTLQLVHEGLYNVWKSCNSRAHACSTVMSIYEDILSSQCRSAYIVLMDSETGEPVKQKKIPIDWALRVVLNFISVVQLATEDESYSI